MIKVLGKLKERGKNEGDIRLRGFNFFLTAVVEEIVGSMWENKKNQREKGEKEGFEDVRNLFQTSAGIWSDEDTRENGFFFLFV